MYPVTTTKVKSDLDTSLNSFPSHTHCFDVIADLLLPLLRSLEIPHPQITINTYELVIKKCMTELFKKPFNF